MMGTPVLRRHSSKSATIPITPSTTSYVLSAGSCCTIVLALKQKYRNEAAPSTMMTQSYQGTKFTRNSCLWLG